MLVPSLVTSSDTIGGEGLAKDEAARRRARRALEKRISGGGGSEEEWAEWRGERKGGLLRLKDEEDGGLDEFGA